MGKLFFLLLFFVSFCANALNQVPTLNNDGIDKQALKKVQHLLNIPEDKINFAYAKLVIDQIVDPTINIFKEQKRLKKMVKDIEALNLTTNSEKKEALREYLYESGVWNNYKPFTYDFNDPKGTRLKTKLLSTYLNTRRGNCISMPFLFIALGQLLGLDVTASTAPLHVFVKYTDDNDFRTHNIETTSGGHPARDAWLVQNFDITNTALKNGIYLQKLTKKETVAVMAGMLLQYYHEQRRFKQLLAMADLILSYYPKSVNTVIYKASAYNEMIKDAGLWQHHKPSDVPARQRELFKQLTYGVNFHHHQAERMGWRQPSLEENEAYVKMVTEVAKRQR